MEIMCEASTKLEDIPGRVAALGEPIMIAYGCYVVECNTDNGYVYLAVNPDNGRTEVLSRRKTYINYNDTKSFNALVTKLKQSGIAGYGRLNIDRKFGEQVSLNKCKEVLSEIFNSILPQYDFAVRKSQMELAEEILDALNRRQVLLAEGETGTGKTWAYLIAVILIKRGRVNDFWNMGHYPKMQYMDMAHMPIVVSTSSIALQKALIENYIPMLSEILLAHEIIDTPITAVLRKGRGHYVCEQKLRVHIQNEADPVTKQILTYLLNVVSKDKNVDLSEIADLSSYTKRRICVPSQCDYNCPHFSDCAYLNFRNNAQCNKIDIQVCNHQYLLADTINRAADREPLIPNCQSIIIDEAHKFEQAAQSMYSLEFSNRMVTEIKDNIDRLNFRKELNGRVVRKLAKKWNKENQRLFVELVKNGGQSGFSDFDRYASVRVPSANVSPADCPDIFPAPDESERLTVDISNKVVCHLLDMLDISDELVEVIEKFPVASDASEYQSLILREIVNFQNLIDRILDVEDYIFWLEMDGVGHMSGRSSAVDSVKPLDYTKELKLCAMPKDLNQKLYADLFSKGIPIVLTSGTLSTGGDFTHIRRQMGIDRLTYYRLKETSKPSPFDYENNVLIYIGENLPFPNNKDYDYIFLLANEIEELLYASYGHAAVLFTSYRAMDMVWEHLSDRGLPFPMFRMDKGGTHAIEQFRASNNGVLFASGSMWEGIDIPGDTLSMLIIPKLPFAAPDPINDYERTLYADMFDFKQKVIIPEMLIKLKQGFGRLIRTVKDSGCVAILDSRVNKHGLYRGRMLSILPPCHVTDCIGTVEKFFKFVKPAEYHK